MTDDIERSLGDLAEEPPPEIVLAAVRAFRYRFIATVAAIIAGAFLLGAIWRVIGPDNIAAEVASLRQPTIVPMLAVAGYDGINVAVTELVWDESTGYLRYVAWDEGSHAEVTVEPMVLTTSTGRTIELFAGSVPALAHFSVPGERDIDRRTSGDWIRFEDADHDPLGPLSLEVQLVISPLEIVLEGGVLEGPFPTLTLRFDGIDLK